jgi:hypothetical protein
MSRPAKTVVVKDDAGVPRQRDPVDAREIVEQGGTYDVTEKDMAKAAQADDNHPIGQSGIEQVEAHTEKLLDNVEAKGGPAAKAQAKREKGEAEAKKK